MRHVSAQAPQCPVCHTRMKKNGRDRYHRQRWMCTSCTLTSRKPGVSHKPYKHLVEFLSWLLGASRQPDAARGFRKRIAWCWNLIPQRSEDSD
ncbi:transposase-like zinc-binding domain-containing protein [Alloscardovia macacae]